MDYYISPGIPHDYGDDELSDAEARKIFRQPIEVDPLDEILKLNQLGATVQFTGKVYIHVYVVSPTHFLINSSLLFNVTEKEKCAAFLRRTRIQLEYRILGMST
jgi:hypothetical protein